MGYYPILDRAPKGRDEGADDWQAWIRRHDEYGGPDHGAQGAGSAHRFLHERADLLLLGGGQAFQR